MKSEMFLYLLMRDKLPVGDVNALLGEVERADAMGIVQFSDPDLLEIASKMAARLEDEEGVEWDESRVPAKDSEPTRLRVVPEPEAS